MPLWTYNKIRDKLSGAVTEGWTVPFLPTCCAPGCTLGVCTEPHCGPSPVLCPQTRDTAEWLMGSCCRREAPVLWYSRDIFLIKGDLIPSCSLEMWLPSFMWVSRQLYRTRPYTRQPLLLSPTWLEVEKSKERKSWGNPDAQPQISLYLLYLKKLQSL